jgi:hypothetical protein
MDECGPAVSRLCVATRGGGEPLRSIQESAGFYRLYLTNDPVGGAEFAVAAPGLDEVSLIADLIDAIHQQVMTTLGQGQPVLAGFHVGIIKLTDTGFGGIGVERALALIRDPDVTAQVTLRVAAADSARGGLSSPLPSRRGFSRTCARRVCPAATGSRSLRQTPGSGCFKAILVGHQPELLRVSSGWTGPRCSESGAGWSGTASMPSRSAAIRLAPAGPAPTPANSGSGELASVASAVRHAANLSARLAASSNETRSHTAPSALENSATGASPGCPGRW